MDSGTPRTKVVVTGLGVLSGAGHDADSFWSNLLAGRSGIRRVENFDTSAYPCRVGCEVRDFNPADFMDPKEVKRNDRYTHYAVAATRQAMADAGLEGPNTVHPDNLGVIIGSGIGGLETIATQTERLLSGGPRKVSPFMIPSLIANIASGVVAIEIGAKGPNFSVVSACATGTHAIGEAYHTICRGEAEVMVAGGSEAAITPLGFAGFCSMRAMSTQFNDRPEAASRPFDANRDGFVMGDGAGVLVLESLQHAQARGARIYAELAGYASTCDAYHITSPDLEGYGLALCLNRALQYSGVEASEVGYINAHGTSTPYNDKTESLAIRKVFGTHADKLLVSSTKSMTGHLLGAAGGIEAAVIAKVLQEGWVPPTINYETPDPECDLDYVPNCKRQADIEVAISDNLGFGGHNAAIVMRRYRP